jgi:uncharacterized protein YbcI
VRCYRRLVGRGPTKAKAVFHGDIVVVLLQDILTIGERTLVADGRQAAVRQFREAIHAAMNAELAGLVEAQTGCHVLTAMSTTDVDRDLAAELFLLERVTP